MATVMAPAVQNVMSTLVMELLNGQLSDETVNAVDHIQRSEVPAPLGDVVAFIHGMSMQPHLRQSIIRHLLIELSSGCEELAHSME
jgi:hypothetical protein